MTLCHAAILSTAIAARKAGTRPTVWRSHGRSFSLTARSIAKGEWVSFAKLLARDTNVGSTETETRGAAVLGVIVPAFNEAPTIGQVLRRVLLQDCVRQVVVVDDCSTDP